ncbi:phosphoglucomutase-1-like protein [Leptotrombidium deliense]|uniref:phosphoglucomutase (alpha-D-glucose-1,6-bisphosphate-dependent) n=1 Tax=Leptotrombidium deliense TaxID=299467 RepID=A0A443SWU6_9ACAR|nr:phosphoglucomutase-1-like protein [Leptotrombidium deliense]
MEGMGRVEVVPTKHIDGMKPGTSGLRKPTLEFMSSHYTENFLQSIFDAVEAKEFLVVGGDGRYYVQEAVKKIVQIAAANNVKRLIVGRNGVLSTPAVSCLIRQHKADGGIILTASHNPGGEKGDFGIKFNVNNGGPAPEAITNRIYECTLKITKYKLCRDVTIDVTKLGITEIKTEDNVLKVEVVDSVKDYVSLLKDIFDFHLLRQYLSNTNNKILIDCMNGVMGPYAKQVFIQELGAPEASVIRSVPLPDFGGHHPDPNLTYAADLVNLMKQGNHIFGAAFDGDGDRNMILGYEAFFVTPSDSLAVIAANMNLIPYFKKTGVKGFARSMPTAGAVDQVAKKMNLPVYETPTGWKFFGNLMDASKLSLCGEESFGTGSDHIREKDGLWAVLSWLTILANQQQSVNEIVMNHWKTFGRNFFTRYDYEDCDAERCAAMMVRMDQLEAEKALIGKKYDIGGKQASIVLQDNFQYKDPIDNSVTTKQGVRIIFDDGSRIILRLSGTGSKGATVRLYVDGYTTDPNMINEDAQKVLKPLIDIALDVIQIKHFTGCDKPHVIT